MYQLSPNLLPKLLEKNTYTDLKGKSVFFANFISQPDTSLKYVFFSNCSKIITMKMKLLGTICCLAVLVGTSQMPAFCDNTALFMQHYEMGQTNLNQGQYSSAIVEFRKALRINFMDNSARIGLVNSYLARASYYANQEKNYDKAANDFRSALFYLKMFPSKNQTIENASGMIVSATDNLNQCLNVSGFDKTSESRYKKAEELRAIGNLSAAAYEFSQAAKNEKMTADADMQIADLMKLLGNDEKSAYYYKLALDLKPNDGVLRMKYARTLDKIGQYDDAVTQYNVALANSKGDMEVLYALERIYLKKLSVTPSDAELNANLGAIKQAQNDYDSALMYYSKAEQLNPNSVTTRLNVGTLFQQKRDFQRAIKSYDSVLTLYPDNVQANLYKAQALSEMGDKKGSMALYKKVLSLEPNNATAKNELTVVLQDTLTPDEYIAYLKQNSSDKNMRDLLYEYALKMHKNNKYDNAISAYKAVIETSPNNVDAYVNLAITYAAKDDYKNASAILNTAKAKFPNNNLVLKTLKEVESDSVSTVLSDASASYEKQDYNGALKKYMEIKPETEDSLLGIAACYQGLENYAKAIEYYKKAETISPNNAEIPYYIGYLYSEQQKWIESEGYLRKSLKINPESDAKALLPYVVQNNISKMLDEAISMYEKNSFDTALTKFNDILKKDTQNSYAYYYRALIYDEQKKTALAINDYKNVLKYSQDIPIANYMLAIDYDSQANYKEAAKSYKQFISSYTTEDEYLQYAKSRVKELEKYAG